MATVVSLSSISPNLNMNSKNFTSQPTYSRKLSRVRCNVENSSTKGEPEPRNALLKIAWYGSELLGIAASFLRSPSPSDVENDLKLATDGSGAAELDRATVVEAIKEDFARSYFVTGNITLDAYEEDCEFADPAGSFKGLRRFKRNCTNFGLLIDKSNMNLTRIRESDIGDLIVSCHFPGDLFFLQLDIQSIISMQKLEEYAGMWSIGMFPKWHCLSKS
ncbi:hypothetical protein KPL70_010104 [Citrus sinensis]|uniref:Uncharacterized protein n=2 Tax=Citrus TaxID=2706 RepID=A0ACB8MQP1_CITSI|nr:hypothetical protein CICLE_v10022006mg [Citrus x clementina]KAH9731807.1 hypothetical protein KPL70_010104 [Citrus sinensis]KAH9787730.1 hypothetical protein KPL71_010680 [Citrus sinensis]